MTCRGRFLSPPQGRPWPTRQARSKASQQGPVLRCRLEGSGTLLMARPDGEDEPVLFTHHSNGMKQNLLTSPFSDIRLVSAAVVDGVWVAEAQKLSTAAACPRCQAVSSARHSSYQRRLWDLPIQGRPVRITLTVGRWQSRNAECSQSIFTERLPGIVDPRSRQTRRVADILRLLGHEFGGRPGERLATRLGLAGGQTTILWHLLHHQGLPDHPHPGDRAKLPRRGCARTR
jgi:zinc-finger of transposase IS204/IS1001/IS1096/IS1165